MGHIGGTAGEDDAAQSLAVMAPAQAVAAFVHDDTNSLQASNAALFSRALREGNPLYALFAP